MNDHDRLCPPPLTPREHLRGLEAALDELDALRERVRPRGESFIEVKDGVASMPFEAYEEWLAEDERRDREITALRAEARRLQEDASAQITNAFERGKAEGAHGRAVAVAQLRHLYAQMLAGQVHDTARAARGLLGPAIEELEGEGV